MSLGPVDVSKSPFAVRQTLPLDAIEFQDGFWRSWQTTNRTVSLHHGYEQLHKFGNFNNLQLAAGRGTGSYRTPVFMDSDIYKWLEAIAYEIAHQPDAALEKLAEEAVDLIEAAQGADGYLNSYWQVVEPERRWQDLQHGHELYCAGHLFQAAVAYYRATGKGRILQVACRFADYIDTVFGPGKRAGTPGHPEIETALVELYRTTQERRYLELAQYFVDQRGRGLLGNHRLGSPAYYQDHLPVRQAKTVEGHAVRQLYLTAGVTDLYLETGDEGLMTALEHQWHDMVSRKLHITGGLGAQHSGEAFGEPYELPNERAYCETCAQIASIHWNWRMYLATGQRRFIDLLELTLYNSFLSGISLDGRRYFYVNSLLSRGADPLLGRKRVERPEWHGCACCPPNVMRLLASLGHYFATLDSSGVQLHLYTSATIHASFDGGRHSRLAVKSNYPWSGTVEIRVEVTDTQAWTLALRLPDWSRQASTTVNGTPIEGDARDGYIHITRSWQAGDVVILELTIQPEPLMAHPRIDPTRASVALRRGPLIYCLEDVDQLKGVRIEDVTIALDAQPVATWQPELLHGIIILNLEGTTTELSSWGEALYRPVGDIVPTSGEKIRLTAIPYYAWANRGANAMRVWIATTS